MLESDVVDFLFTLRLLCINSARDTHKQAFSELSYISTKSWWSF